MTRSTTVARLRQMLNGDLDTIVLKALKKKPAERYATVTALADDLRRYLRNEPIAARPDSVTYRVTKFSRRHRSAVVLATVALLALVGGLVGTLIQARVANAERVRADRQAADATAQRDFARRQLARAEAINDLNAFLIADAAPLGSTFTARELLARAERIVTRQADDTDGTRIESLVSIGRLYTTLGETAKANTILQQAYDLSGTQSDLSLRAKASCEFGRAISRTGDFTRARQLVDDGLKTLLDEPQFALARVLCRLSGSSIENWAGDGNQAVSHTLSAQSAAENSGVSSPLLSLRIVMDLAESYRIAGRYTEANDAFADAHARLAALGREDTERAGTLLNNWGLVLGSLGRPREAERMLRRSIEISSAGGSDEHIEPISWANLARSLFDLGRHSESIELAERAYRRAIDRGENVVADQALLLSARLHVVLGNVDRGETMLNEVEAHFKKMFSATHSAFTAVAMDRIRIAENRGNLPDALSLATQALATAEGNANLQSFLPQLLRRRAEINVKLRRFAAARTDAERSLDLVLKRIPAGALAAGAGLAYLSLGEAYAGESRTSEARDALTKAVSHLDGSVGADHPASRRARQLLAQP